MKLKDYLALKVNKEHALTDTGVWEIHAPVVDNYAPTYLRIVTGTLEQAIKRALRMKEFIYEEPNQIYVGTVVKATDWRVNRLTTDFDDTIKDVREKIARLAKELDEAKKTKAVMLRDAKEVRAFLKKA